MTMTEAEERVMRSVTNAWNDYVLLLSPQHSDEQEEFRAAIHRLQDLIAARPTWRALPLSEMPR